MLLASLWGHFPKQCQRPMMLSPRRPSWLWAHEAAFKAQTATLKAPMMLTPGRPRSLPIIKSPMGPFLARSHSLASLVILGPFARPTCLHSPYPLTDAQWPISPSVSFKPLAMSHELHTLKMYKSKYKVGPLATCKSVQRHTQKTR